MVQCRELLRGFEYECIKGSTEVEVSELVKDSREITKDCLFICIQGANFDGHTAAAEAVNKGAAVLVVSQEVVLPAGAKVTVIKVEDTRYAMAFLSANYFGNPAESMKIIGVTGTKGKTTTAYFVKYILERAGYKVGLVGTIETIIGEKVIPSSHTTPESYDLQRYFKEMKEAGCQVVVMEASSQGFKMHRTQGFVFDYGIFTNIEPDHIAPGEHADFDEYLACKAMLFRQCRVGIVNCDDAHWRKITEGHTCTLETYGFDAEADLRGSDLKLVTGAGYLGIDFKVSGLLNMEIETDIPGKFSAYNALTAIAICRHFGVKEQDIKNALLRAKVKGRIEMVKVSDEFTMMIDYAHNAMSLESLLHTLRDYHPERIVTVFGCGGNRAKSRRYEMGEASGRLADLSVITADNSRFENVLDIIADIKVGINKTGGKYIEIPDRREAIRWCLEHAEEGDIIVLAGKGHEDYQEIQGVKHPFDERVVIREILDSLKKA